MEHISIIEQLKEHIATATDKEHAKRYILRTLERQSVMSFKTTNLGPHLTGKDVHIYINKHQNSEEFDNTQHEVDDAPSHIITNNVDVVVVLKDIVYDGGQICAEIANEDAFNDNIPLWYSKGSHRFSPYHNLCVATKVVKDFIMEKELLAAKNYCKEHNTHIKLSINAMALLLTNSHVINAEDMQQEWASLIEFLEVENFTLVDNLPQLHTYELPLSSLPSDYMTDFFAKVKNGEVKFEWKGYFLHNIPALNPDIENETESEHNKFIDSLKKEFLCDTVKEDGLEFDDDNDDDDEIFDPFPLNDFSSDSTSVNAEIFDLLDNPEKELKGMIGLDNVKTKLKEVSYLIAYNQLLKSVSPSAPLHSLNLHGMFMGNPGTGKTTMGRIWSAMLKKAGLLTKGHLVLANRSSFLGTKWGQEEENVKKLLNKAEGGTLMIDEAYSLVSKHESDPGRMVLLLLLSILSDENKRNISIILAGYPEEMKQLLDTNPGIVSRFSNCFEFQDFSLPELLDITRAKVTKYGYSFTKKAWEKYIEIVTTAYNNRDSKTFGNGRYVANLLERIYIQHAKRVVEKQLSGKNILRITEQDIVPYNDANIRMKRITIGFNR